MQESFLMHYVRISVGKQKKNYFGRSYQILKYSEIRSVKFLLILSIVISKLQTCMIFCRSQTIFLRDCVRQRLLINVA